MYKVTHDNKNFFFYYTAVPNHEFERGTPILGIQDLSAATKAIIEYPLVFNSENTYTMDGLNGLNTGTYYSQEKLAIKNAMQQESEMYVRVTIDGSTFKGKIEASAEYDFGTTITLEQNIEFNTLVASGAVSENGAKICEHIWDSRGTLMVFQKTQTDSSKTYVQRAEFIHENDRPK